MMGITPRTKALAIVWMSALFPLLIYPIVIFGYSVIGVSWSRMLPNYWGNAMTFMASGSLLLFFLGTALYTKENYSKILFFCLLGVAILANVAFLCSEIVLWGFVYGD